VENWIVQMMEDYGYFGIFLVMVAENLFPPIPSEIVLPFGGFVATMSELTVPMVIAVATLGSAAGAVILYLVGSVLSRPRVEAIIERWGRLLRITRRDTDKAFEWFERYGKWTVFFGRMVPLVRSLISVPAGMAGMNFPLFLIYTVAGSLIWNCLLVGIGAALGSSWHRIAEFVDIYANIIYALLAVAAVGVLVWLITRRTEDND